MRYSHAGPSDLAIYLYLFNRDLTVAAITSRPFGPNDDSDRVGKHIVRRYIHCPRRS